MFVVLPEDQNVHQLEVDLGDHEVDQHVDHWGVETDDRVFLEPEVEHVTQVETKYSEEKEDGVREVESPQNGGVLVLHLHFLGQFVDHEPPLVLSDCMFGDV